MICFIASVVISCGERREGLRGVGVQVGHPSLCVSCSPDTLTLHLASSLFHLLLTYPSPSLSLSLTLFHLFLSIRLFIYYFSFSSTLTTSHLLHSLPLQLFSLLSSSDHLFFLFLFSLSLLLPPFYSLSRVVNIPSLF